MRHDLIPEESLYRYVEYNLRNDAVELIDESIGRVA